MRTATPGSKSYNAMRLPHESFLLSRLTLARASKGHGTVSARASSKLYSICLSWRARAVAAFASPGGGLTLETAHTFKLHRNSYFSKEDIENEYRYTKKTNNEIPSENPPSPRPWARGTTGPQRSSRHRGASRLGGPARGSSRRDSSVATSGPRTALPNAKAVTTWRSRPIRHH